MTGQFVLLHLCYKTTRIWTQMQRTEEKLVWLKLFYFKKKGNSLKTSGVAEADDDPKFKSKKTTTVNYTSYKIKQCGATWLIAGSNCENSDMVLRNCPCLLKGMQ